MQAVPVCRRRTGTTTTTTDQAVRDDASVCDYCSGAFGVEDAVVDAEVVTPDDHDGHPSIRSPVDDDYEIITF